MGPSKVCINLGLFNFLKVIVKFRITKCDLKKKKFFFFLQRVLSCFDIQKVAFQDFVKYCCYSTDAARSCRTPVSAGRALPLPGAGTWPGRKGGSARDFLSCRPRCCSCTSLAATVVSETWPLSWGWKGGFTSWSAHQPRGRARLPCSGDTLLSQNGNGERWLLKVCFGFFNSVYC